MYARRLASLLAIATVVAAVRGPSALAQDDRPDSVITQASGAIGAGVFDRQATTAVDVGVDVAGRDYALGVGARLRFLLTDGFRAEDWDERSEWANIVRYVNHVRDHGSLAVAIAVGELGGVRLGHGAVLDGYASGLDIDHRHLGGQVRLAGARFGAEAMVDDLVAPRIIGAHGYWQRGPATRALMVGASLVADISAPTRATMAGQQVLPLASLDGRWQLATDDGRLSGALYGNLAAMGAEAAGVHAGLEARILGFGASFALRGELRLGSDGYIPGYIGPLYELKRQPLRMEPGGPMPGADGMPVDSQLDIARRGGLGGLGGVAELRAHAPGLGEVSAYYARRAGLADLLVARIGAPYLRDIQVAAWLAAEVGAGAEDWVLASEVRVRLNRRFFTRAEGARMYRRQDGVPEPMWMVSASFGATLGL